ncbi:MAG: hypothetical protein MUE93_01815 [Ignavibacteriaceae bacterium]|jgi:hypothetical protein|nr:hypothetical protein [Ignavibacteriaceae bacterium]MCU0364394.1 hypothetical protein [Ignavibacteriaceae bacterium]MCU0405687.1 hypothetical protein [Ignavibacteriaceae bacterium]MCU0413301.1 hypothetical protein [Ignavibacteriaceae bacterium]
MKNKIRILIVSFILLMILAISGCGTGQVSIGVGVYVPGAWGGPYSPGYYPPVGVGYPLY